MIDRSHDLPITRQVQVLSVSRGSAYYRPRAISGGDLAIMRRMDELHLEYGATTSSLSASGAR